MNMKRIKLKLATAILLGSLMSSCYEDKGNYDYEQMNDITVEIPLESNDCVLGDVLKITPELKFLTGKETENLTYLWTFDGQEIATERVLNWIVDKDGKYKDLRLAGERPDYWSYIFRICAVVCDFPLYNRWLGNAFCQGRWDFGVDVYASYYERSKIHMCSDEGCIWSF